MRRILYSLITILFISSTVGAASGYIDSLKQELTHLRPVKKLPLLIELAGYYSDSARYHVEVESYLQEALSILNKRENDSLKIVVLNYYGLSDFSSSNYEEAVSHFYMALALAEKNGEQTLLSKLYNNLGMVFDEIEDYDQAITFYQKSIEIDSIQKNEKGIGISYINLAISYQNKLKLDSAFFFNQKALAIAEKYQDSTSIVNVINNLGTLEYNRKNYTQSLEYYEKALSLYQEINDLDGVATVYNNLGLIYLDKKQYDRALPNFKKALVLAQKLEIADFIGDIYSNLSIYYEEMGDYKNAFHYYDLYNVVYDSLIGETKSRNIRKIEAQYKLDEKQLQIQTLQQQNLDQEKMINLGQSLQLYLYIIIFLVLAILITGYFLFRKERKLSNELKQKTDELKKSNLAKDKFFSIIAHDLKNPFNALISYTSLLKEDIDRFTREELTQILTDLNNATERGFNLLENLLYWTRSQTNRIKIYKSNFNLYEVIHDVKELAESNMDEKMQTLEINMDRSLEVFADKDMIATVMRNLVFNSVKFSNPQTKIKVEVERISQKLQVSIIDQGIGISPEDHMRIFNYEENVSTSGTAGEMGSGLGLVICREFIEKNGGIIWVESRKGEGATFRFTLPLATPISSNE